MNSCDHLDRRVQKITPKATHSFFYDGWMLVKEVMANTNGTTEVVEYHWGNDLSGSRSGAAGVGGLLYLTAPTPPLQTPPLPTPPLTNFTSHGTTTTATSWATGPYSFESATRGEILSRIIGDAQAAISNAGCHYNIGFSGSIANPYEK